MDAMVYTRFLRRSALASPFGGVAPTSLRHRLQVPGRVAKPTRSHPTGAGSRDDTHPPHPEIPDAVLLGTKRFRLFWLLHKHHNVLAAQWKGCRISWDAVCEWAKAEEAWDMRGKPPKAEAARKTWERVRDLKAREQAKVSGAEGKRPTLTR